jgi:hypothetical protein
MKSIGFSPHGCSRIYKSIATMCSQPPPQCAISHLRRCELRPTGRTSRLTPRTAFQHQLFEFTIKGRLPAIPFLHHQFPLTWYCCCRATCLK